jgi:hypothetical protein
MGPAPLPESLKIREIRGGGEQDSRRKGLDMGHSSRCWRLLCQDAKGAGALCEFDFEIEFKF